MNPLYNVGWGVFGNIIKNLISGIAIIYIVRNSLSEDFGELSVALIYLVAGKAMASVGTQPIALRFLYKYKKTSRIINSVFRLQLIASITLILLGLLGALVFYAMNDKVVISSLYLISLDFYLCFDKINN